MAAEKDPLVHSKHEMIWLVGILGKFTVIQCLKENEVTVNHHKEGLTWKDRAIIKNELLGGRGWGEQIGEQDQEVTNFYL